MLLEISPKEALYRMAQEALHNVVKHAQARMAELTLEMDQTTVVVLTVRDFGRGFEFGPRFRSGRIFSGALRPPLYAGAS